MHHPTDRITHTTAFVTPVVEHWLEREIAQWVHPMKDRSDDPSHHERTLYLWVTSRSYSGRRRDDTFHKNEEEEARWWAYIEDRKLIISASQTNRALGAHFIGIDAFVVLTPREYTHLITIGHSWEAGTDPKQISKGEGSNRWLKATNLL